MDASCVAASGGCQTVSEAMAAACTSASLTRWLKACYKGHITTNDLQATCTQRIPAAWQPGVEACSCHG
jgi:hypothetical protein